MNAPGRIIRLLGIAALLSVLSAGSVFPVGGGAWTGGILLGAFLGAGPFASWAWVVTRGLESRRNKIIAAVIVASKFGVYTVAILFLVRNGLVSTLAVTAGMTGTLAILLVGMLIRPVAGAGEAA